MSTIPFTRRPRPFYGWTIVACAWLASFTTTTVNPLIFAFFITPMSESLDISRGTLVWGFTIRQIAGGLSAPVLGRLVDRYGTRWIGAGSGVLVGGVLIAFAFVSNIWALYALFLLSGLTGFGTIGANLLTIVPVTNWFVAKRGRAVSIASTGTMIGTASMTLAAALLIDSVGWQATWAIFGIAIIATILPTYLLFMRRRPEDMGLLPDGVAAPTPRADGVVVDAPPVEIDWTLRQAMRTRVLWAVIIALAISQFATGPLLLYRVAFWQDMGIAPAIIALGIAADPFTVTFSMMAFGLLAERVAIRWMGVVGAVWRGISVLPLWFAMGGAPGVFMHNVTWGTGSGSHIVLQNLLFPQYFGRTHQGAIRGFTAPLMISAGALGAPLAGYLLDAGLGYTALWQICFLLIVLPGVVFIFVRPPKPLPEMAPPDRVAEAPA